MTLPYLPLQTGDAKHDVDALYGYMSDFISNFANATGNAVDPKSGEGGDGALTVDDIPSNIQYDPGSSLSIDENIFGFIDVSADLPDRAVDMAIKYRETGTGRFKVSYSGSDDSSFRLMNLKIGESYQIRVAGRAANNSVGPYSELVTVAIPTTGFLLKAPVNAEYVVTQLHDKLSAEKLLTDTSTITNDISGASQVKLNVVPDSSVQKIEVVKNSGAVVGTRKQINFIEGTDVSLVITDDSINNQIDVTISAAGSAGVSDGDKGDITVTGSGTVWTIDNSYNPSVDRLVGVGETRIVPNTHCVVASRYFSIVGVLDLQGDAVLEIL